MNNSAAEPSFSYLAQSCRSLTKEYGTPLFVLSVIQLRKQLEALKAAWSDWPGLHPQFYYPLKANDFIPFLRLTRDYDLGLDVTESAEIDIALQDIGVAPARVILNGPAKERHLLQKAVSNGIRIHVDSFEELQDVKAVATMVKRPARVGIRLRFGTVSKFGFCPTDPELEEALLLLAHSAELSLVAIHQHDPVSVNSTEQLEARLASIAAFIDKIRARIGPIELEIDLGGGLNLQSNDGEFRSFSDFVAAFISSTNRTRTQGWRFGFEWGRAIVGPCGLVVSKVIRKKQSQGTTWIYLDAGQNIVGGRHANVTHTVVATCNASSTIGNGLQRVNLAGPLCFTSDVILENLCAPPLDQGDILIIGEAGAYTFNTRWRGAGREPVVLLESDSGIHHMGRLSQQVSQSNQSPRLLADLFHLFFEEEFGTSTQYANSEIAFGISSGTNQLDPPESLRSLLTDETSTWESIKAYTGPHGSDEIVVTALAYEEALATTRTFHKNRCVVTLGAAQGCARALDYLFNVGCDHCVLVGPQYPLIYDLLRQARFEASELIGEFKSGYLPSEESVVDLLLMRPRSVLFLTVPNNPTGSSPTEPWLKAVFEAVSQSNGHVVIDRSSEELPLAPWVCFSPTTMIAAQTLPERAYTVVNTVSKSRSVPGLRLGYLLGSEPMAKSVADFNYVNYLSIPRAGTRFVCGDLLLRSLWWRHTQLGQTFEQAMEMVRSTVCRSDTPSITESDFVAIASLYPKYVDECTANLDTIKQAQREFIAGLQEYWLGCTPHHNGFNVIAEITGPRSGQAFSKTLFRETGIRLFPSECFSFQGLPLEGTHEGLTFRLSSADKPHRLRAAAEILRDYL
jgi:diaminopimelate decarboxylase